MKRAIIYPYVVGSASARGLATALTTVQVREQGRYRPRENHVVIGWGSPRTPEWWHLLPPNTPFLNQPRFVLMAGNKLEAFHKFAAANIRTPEWTTNQNEARQWIAEGQTVVCRALLSSHSGKGITVASTLDQIIPAPLYTKYKKKKHEYRVHVFQGQVIDVQAKRRRKDYAGEVNSLVRSYHTGWVYCRENLVEPQGIRELAIAATAALNLDFCAVDIIWNQHENLCYVLEVNTAPGLEGTTLSKYVEAIRRLL